MLATQHGLPSGRAHGEGDLYPVRHALEGHMAALLHPHSSRAVVPGAVAAAWPGEEGAPVATSAARVPLGLAILAAALAAALVVAGRRP